MNNLQQPAFPLPISHDPAKKYCDKPITTNDVGFTKLEYAAILIAQGLVSRTDAGGRFHEYAETAVGIATAVIEECNK